MFELENIKTLPEEILREIALLDLMARELSGRIVILTKDSAIKTKIEHFASPPVVPCVTTREEAMKAFAPKTDGLDGAKSAAQVQAQANVAAATAPAPNLAPKPVAVAGAAPGTPDDKQGLYKEQLKQREITELGPLRKQVADLENENKLIRDQLHAMVVARRSAADPKALEDKLKLLEQQLADLLAQSQAPAKK